MLYLVQSNKMECLAESLVSCLQETAKQNTPLGKGASIFEPEQILVQSPGMSQWLKIQIAGSLGITANIDFPLPSSFIWQLYQQHIQDLPDQSAFTKANMTWKLMSILPLKLLEPEFKPIEQYLLGSKPLKLYQLATKIADVYDQYLVYRPDWILHWEAGHNDLPTETNRQTNPTNIVDAHPWQPILWRALIAASKNLKESPFHRANLHHSLLEALHTSNDSQARKPLMVFGISAMPLQQLEVLSALSKSRDVLIFWFNPSQHYWGDIVDEKTQAKAQLKALNADELSGVEFLDVGNPLLASWGKLGRDYQDMLLGFEFQPQDCFIESRPQCLLHHIQTDINQLQFRATNQPLDASELLSNGKQFPKVDIKPTDNSIQVHACHSKVRELEVLHDQLLQRFNDNPNWHPGDVIVMMPDVASYAPFIDGVFGAVASKLAIPYAISDRNVGQVSPLLSSFLEAMKLHQSRLTLSSVLSLLEVPAILRKFAIDPQEFELIQHWLTDAGVRWGWNEQDKQRWDLPSEKQNTWVFGLQRLLAGYAMSSETLFKGSQEHISAYADIEGQQAVALGKCYQFTGLLIKMLAFCQQPQNIPQKVTQALELLTELYDADESEQTDLQILRETLEKMLLHSHQFTAAIDQDVFVSELQQNIQEKGVGQRFLAGYVNFCTLMPMRSIPFKVVCLLGINDTDYPRQSVPMGFDLMRLAPIKRGDRSRRLDDRYLFLEALLSAREQLYFSYIGFSQKDNSPLAPSILLSELIEYCQQGFCLEGQWQSNVTETEQNILAHLTTNHKLQPFDQGYFETTTSSDLLSFNHKQQAIAQQLRQPPLKLSFSSEPLPHSQEQTTQVELDTLIEFFHNPAKAFFMQRWQTRFYPLAQQNTDEEPFAFNGLDKYQLNQRLIQHFLAAHSGLDAEPEELNHREIHLTELLNKLKAEGKLPTGKSAEIVLEPLVKNSNQLVKQLAELHLSMDKKHSVDVDISINKMRIVARIDNLYAQNLLLWRPGKLRAKDRITLYLQWLVLCACPPKTGLDQAHFVSMDKLYSLNVIESSIAIQNLQIWKDSWLRGTNELLHFYPDAAWQWASSFDENKTLNSFVGNDFALGEGSEAHIQRVCPDLSEHFTEFSQLAELLLLPLVELGEAP
ncbi:exodeoxyribonuclease V subunit gamma [uncultured Paraglaciecola sp.]|uniref:exodeoxyribonuclease V subunit gamma n=1 Tax=uncultured Paraglaciecola sp. TaxID=1765024 RepID=UPI00260BE9C5|nr:exodeoxyribonuclease V subunit gamma [uncultured Paraglaciecola sp.]